MWGPGLFCALQASDSPMGIVHVCRERPPARNIRLYVCWKLSCVSPCKLGVWCCRTCQLRLNGVTRPDHTSRGNAGICNGAAVHPSAGSTPEAGICAGGAYRVRGLPCMHGIAHPGFHKQPTYPTSETPQAPDGFQVCRSRVVPKRNQLAYESECSQIKGFQRPCIWTT